MTKVTLIDTRRRTANTDLGHRASVNEGEAARRLLVAQGYVLKRTSRREHEFRCPFHEGPGEIEPRRGTNFYVNADTGAFYCHAASCGERGGLHSLERFFGIDVDEEFIQAVRTREELLREYEAALTAERRQPFYDHGLSDDTIERFRYGYDEIRRRWVIPYLEGRRPRQFRYYDPTSDSAGWKYTWEEGSEVRLYNAQDAVGDSDGRVVLCEGETKCALLVQLGYAAVGVPGAGQWRDEWQAAFANARQIVVLYDNDNPEFHIYDKPETGRRCQRCAGRGLDACIGHNPGQEAAIARVMQLGWRAKNVLLPLPEGARKTDVNEYFMRDAHSGAELAELVTGKKPAPFRVATFAEMLAEPPEETVFLVDQGILPAAGRLLVAGRPKSGKSIFVDNLALSLCAGIPFLRRFGVDHPMRVLLLDRELSKRSLFDRMNQLIADKPGYRAGIDNLCIDHDHLVRLDQQGAYELLVGLIQANGAEVVILDTAYKFMSDVESSQNLMKSFGVLDRVIAETGVATVLTHHHRKAQPGAGKNDVADPDSVAGSFLWTGWPNATILLNFLNRSIEDPFSALASFVAFRDAAPPTPLELRRTRESISYAVIKEHDEDAGSAYQGPSTKPSTEAVVELLLEMCPVTEEDFLSVAERHFGVSAKTVKPYYLDALAQGSFERSGKPAIVRFAFDAQTTSWESDHGMPEQSAGRDYTVPLFEAVNEQ